MSAPPSEQQLAEIAARAAAATKGPWSLNGKCASNLRDNTSRPVGELICGDADQDFIVHAREDVPALLAEIDRRDKQQSALEDELTELREEYANTVARVAELEARIRIVGTARTYRLESGKKFIYVEDIADAVLGRASVEAGEPA